MDRNIASRQLPTPKPPVALRKESVDRNHVVLVLPRGCWLSLSARRAWIEIVYPGTWSGSILSLSARRAWIEIAKSTPEDAKRRSRSPQGERG